MSCEDIQEEEREVLTSIYDGDTNYKEISKQCFQYKIGTDNEPKSFLLEIIWIDKYPNVPPKISLDAFYNKKLIHHVKERIVSELSTQAEMCLGTAMTYTLIEFAKDNAEELTRSQPEESDTAITPESLSNEDKSIVDDTQSSCKKEKKIRLSKQQKRRLADRLDTKGERPRGWDWVDIVKHLSQNGPKQSENDSS